MALAPLTPEEVKNLESHYDRLMQMAAELDRELYEVNQRMIAAYYRFVESKGALDALKMEKSTLVERARLISRMLSKY